MISGTSASETSAIGTTDGGPGDATSPITATSTGEPTEVVKLVSAQGTIITLLNRPGGAEPADDGSGVFGDSSNLSSSGPIVFFDGAATDVEDMGIGINTHQEICLADGLCEYHPNPGSAAPGALTDLAGEDATGSWRVCVGDAAALDIGSVDFVELTIEQIR